MQAHRHRRTSPECLRHTKATGTKYCSSRNAAALQSCSLRPFFSLCTKTKETLASVSQMENRTPKGTNESHERKKHDGSSPTSLRPTCFDFVGELLEAREIHCFGFHNV